MEVGQGMGMGMGMGWGSVGHGRRWAWGWAGWVASGWEYPWPVLTAGAVFAAAQNGPTSRRIGGTQERVRGTMSAIYLQAIDEAAATSAWR